MYHKIAAGAPTMWWVSAGAFADQMKALMSKKIVYLDDYDTGDPNHVVLTFDDAYECIYEHAFPILKAYGYPFEIFVIGDFTGRPNTFDPGEPIAPCCSLDHLKEMASHGARIQWHTRTHPHLCAIQKSSQEFELDVPQDLRLAFPRPHLEWLAYPYGEHCDAITDIARRRFSGALSVHQGDNADSYRMNRLIVEEGTDIRLLHLVKSAGHGQP